jgi:hypothetical protein
VVAVTPDGTLSPWAAVSSKLSAAIPESFTCQSVHSQTFPAKSQISSPFDKMSLASVQVDVVFTAGSASLQDTFASTVPLFPLLSTPPA